jgi:transcriptional regulator GlxA family with amidase domain
MHAAQRTAPLDVLLVAVHETVGSSLYGLLDVMLSVGTLWPMLTRNPREHHPRFRVRIVAPQADPFSCGNGIPVIPDAAIADDPAAPIIIVPELGLGPDESLHGRHRDIVAWLQHRYRQGASLYSACSGSVLLAETGLLDGVGAASHWCYQDLFRKAYPNVRFDLAPTLVYGRDDGRIVTAGGTTSWHDLALHIIARHASPREALHIAKVYLMKWHTEGQAPYAPLVIRQPHGDELVEHCECWLHEHLREADAAQRVLQIAGLPERTLNRRFKTATGSTPYDYLQCLRIEEAKQLLESGSMPAGEVGAACGLADAALFHSLFAQQTGLSPEQYRRMFSLPDESGEPLSAAAPLPALPAMAAHR